MLDDPVRGPLEASGIASAEQSVKQNVIRLEGGVGFEIATPIAFLVLRGEKKLAGGGHGSAHAGGQTINLAEAKFRCGGYMGVRGVCIHQGAAPLIRGSAGRSGGDGLDKFRAQ